MNKVVFLVRNVSPEKYGGGETYQLMLAEGLRGHGFKPYIVTSSLGLLREARKNGLDAIRAPYINQQNWSGWRNILFPIYCIKILKLRKWYKQVFEEYKPSTVNIQSRDDWVAATKMAKKKHIQVLWTDHLDFRSWVLTNVNVKYKKWNLEDLPMLPERLKLTVIKQTGKQFNAVKSQLLRKDVNEIIVATDAGREGELVARWIIDKVRINKPIKRLWISSVTDKAIKDGFANLKPGKAYDNLYASAVARSEADWYIGLNATGALTTRFNAQLNCGRVQTPTVAMIASREDEIKNFKAQTYYGIEAQTMEKLKLTWQDANGNSRSFNKEKIDGIVKRLDKQNATVVEIDKKQKKSFSPGLYDLTELQRDANKKFGYSAKETLNIMQKLYEKKSKITWTKKALSHK